MKEKIESIAGIFLIIFQFIIGIIALIVIAIVVCVFVYESNDQKILDSNLVGKEVIVPPNAGKAKMTEWSGWTDQYLHLHLQDEHKGSSSEQKMLSFTSFGKFTKLKIFEVRRMNYGLGSHMEICMLKEEANPVDVIVIKCQDIGPLDTYKNLVVEALDLIKNEGQVTLTRDMNPKELNPRTIVIKNEADLWRELAFNRPSFKYINFRFVKNKVEANP